MFMPGTEWIDAEREREREREREKELKQWDHTNERPVWLRQFT